MIWGNFEEISKIDVTPLPTKHAGSRREDTSNKVESFSGSRFCNGTDNSTKKFQKASKHLICVVDHPSH